MKSILKLFIIFLLIGNIGYSQNTETNLTSFAKITFPSDTELTETGIDKVFVSEDSSAIYMVNVRNLSNQNFSFQSEDELLELYNGVTDGTVRSANGELISMEKINLVNSIALDIEYSANSNPDLPNRRFKRIFFYKHNLFNIDFWPLTKEKNVINEKKAKFYNSFLINSIVAKNSVKVTSDNDSNDANIASKTGFIVGQVIFYLFLFAILIGLILLVRYLLKKTKRKNTKSHSVEQPQTKIQKITCKKCDLENNPNTKYCTGCGYELPKS